MNVLMANQHNKGSPAAFTGSRMLLVDVESTFGEGAVRPSGGGTVPFGGGTVPFAVAGGGMWVNKTKSFFFLMLCGLLLWISRNSNAASLSVMQITAYLLL